VIVDCALYCDGVRVGGRLDPDDVTAMRRAGQAGFIWLGLHEPTQDEFGHAVTEFDLHPLAVEDAVKAHQRPKLERYGDSLFLVLKTARYVDATEDVELGEIQMFLGDNFIVVVRHGDAGELASLRRDLEAEPDILRLGPSAVFHGIVDRVVDHYQNVINGLANDVEEVEYDVFGSPRPADPSRIYKLEREVIEALRALRPLIDPLERLTQGDFPLVVPEIRPYFRDVHDHVLRGVDQFENLNDLLTSILGANLAQLGIQQNEDMRKISAWVAIAAVPTMLAGVWGMNFEHMPELGWQLGYPAGLAVMVAIALTLHRLFKRSGWL
jgi:magnesium transporter